MALLDVSIVYAPEKKPLVRIHCSALPEGACIQDALASCHFYALYPETQNLSIGIFSKAAKMHTVLRSGDRIEIYRPLLLDPKERRRQKAKKKRRV